LPELGIYIHYPYCRKRCPYCDFAIAVAPEPEIPHAAYRDAVLSELADRAPDFAGRAVVSIYFGGGTPSLWPVEHLARVIAAVRDTFDAPGSLEVTLEANPTDCTPAAIAGWLAAGINRLSIGVQSLDAGALVTLGRDHRFGDGRAAIRAAMDAGVSRITADAILGVPGAAPAGEPDPTAVALADIDPGHISAYELTIEPRTEIGRAAARGAFVPVDDDALAALYAATHDALAARGYEHYEVSSYARPGHRAVHNSLYWTGAEYLGLGNGAASFRRTPGGAVRTTNVRSARAYLAGERAAEIAPQTSAEVETDRLWLGLRTADGVTGAPEALADWLEAQGLATRDGGRIRPTLRGFLFHDRVARRVVGD
jgi:oxygen-independent coproporphyrinogen-3 oxidase